VDPLTPGETPGETKVAIIFFKDLSLNNIADIPSDIPSRKLRIPGPSPSLASGSFALGLR